MIVTLWNDCNLLAQYEVEPFDSDSEISIDVEKELAYQYADRSKGDFYVTRLFNVLRQVTGE